MTALRSIRAKLDEIDALLIQCRSETPPGQAIRSSDNSRRGSCTVMGMTAVSAALLSSLIVAISVVLFLLVLRIT